jgi:hypothetical protein
MGVIGVAAVCVPRRSRPCSCVGLLLVVYESKSVTSVSEAAGQLLSRPMNADTLTALRHSIEEWEGIVVGSGGTAERFARRRPFPLVAEARFGKYS